MFALQRSVRRKVKVSRSLHDVGLSYLPPAASDQRPHEDSSQTASGMLLFMVFTVTVNILKKSQCWDKNGHPPEHLATGLLLFCKITPSTLDFRQCIPSNPECGFQTREILQLLQFYCYKWKESLFHAYWMTHPVYNSSEKFKWMSNRPYSLLYCSAINVCYLEFYSIKSVAAATVCSTWNAFH